MLTIALALMAWNYLLAVELKDLREAQAKLAHLESLTSLKVQTSEGNYYLVAPKKNSEIYVSQQGNNVLKLQ
jgi:hypothetical protein